jgi:ADP-dependent NAD(P)H-hydrate dehydratase / NAD(P)H-hydrate epimerase
VPRPELLELLRQPNASDDKYSRGVVGFVTGSESYPGAAILGVTAAMRCGIGMVRYLGPRRVGELVLEVRPEAVLTDGSAQAWVVGSGMAAGDDSQLAVDHLALAELAVIDAQALVFADFEKSPIRSVLTPHAGEAVALLARFAKSVDRSEVEGNPARYANELAALTNRVVLLKGSTSIVASPAGELRSLGPLSAALATAGTGDVLAGMLGALLAVNHDRVVSSENDFLNVIELAITLHSAAADLASESGPVAALDVAEAVRKVIANLHD